MKHAAPIEAEVTWRQVHAFRMRRHDLVDHDGNVQMITAVRDMSGAQAQVMSAAEMQIAVRSGARAADVRKGLWHDRKLVKTWLMRGTLHLVPADDLPIYTAAMQGRWMRTRSSWLNYVQMRETELMKLFEQIGAAMNGTPMTRQEILARVGHGHSDRVHELLQSGWGGLLKPVARSGLLCFGPSHGNSVTFVNPRQWLGGWREVDPEAAITEMARRYLRAYGPALKHDFARWWGAWTGVGEAAWSGLAGELAEVSVEGERADVLSADLEALARAEVDGAVVLLPPFDPYLMGHRSRDHLFDARHAPKVSRVAGWISAVVLVDGRVEATWSHAVAAKKFRITVHPFGKLPRRVVSEVHRRAEALAASAGLDRAEVAVSPPAGRS